MTALSFARAALSGVAMFFLTFVPMDFLRKTGFTMRALLLPAPTRTVARRVFRRSVATTLSETREPVRTTEQVLGHSSPHTTLAFYTVGGGVAEECSFEAGRNNFPKCSPVRERAYTNALKGWLGGLDSNQDSQSQSLPELLM
jgi:hypothetical protein